MPAYQPCSTPNREHGPPLAFGSCSPPQPASPHLTIGVGDGSPAFARGGGFVRMDVQVGAFGPPDDSDIHIRFRLTNVMRAGDLSEYTGELRPSGHRAPDGPRAASPTHQANHDGLLLRVRGPLCPDAGIELDASICDVRRRRVNAVIPVRVKDANRALWAFDRLRVYDGGPDEDADTRATTRCS